jgi:hypothetical protein
MRKKVLSRTLQTVRVTSEELAFVADLAETFQVPVSRLLRANLLKLRHSPDPIRSLAAFL